MKVRFNFSFKVSEAVLLAAISLLGFIAAKILN